MAEVEARSYLENNFCNVDIISVKTRCIMTEQKLCGFKEIFLLCIATVELRIISVRQNRSINWNGMGHAQIINPFRFNYKSKIVSY